MDFLHNDLGSLSGNEVVEVTLETAANVKLMDSSNFSSYQNGGPHRYYGGLATRSRLRLTVPHPGHWHLAIDLGGYAGNIRAGVRVIS
jgi:hypothetical protein